MSFKEYLREGAFKVLNHKKKKEGSRLRHMAELQPKGKIDFDEVAFTVGYPPMAYGLSNTKVEKRKDNKWLYTFDTASSAD